MDTEEEFEKSTRENRNLNDTLDNDNFEIICPTCLSKDRAFYHVDGRHKHILMVLGLEIVNIQIICWECYAIVKKIVRFRNIALQSQELLKLENINVLNAFESKSALRTTDVIKVLSISFADNHKDPKTTVFISRPNKSKTTASRNKTVADLSEKSEKSNPFDREMILEHDNNLVEPIKNPESDNKNAAKPTYGPEDVHDENSAVVDQNDTTLETMSNVRLDTESPFNNVIVPETTKTLENSVRFFVDLKDSTTAATTIKYPSLVDQKNTILEKSNNTTLETPNATTLETNNGTSLKTLGFLHVSAKSLAPVGIPLKVMNYKTAEISVEEALEKNKSVATIKPLDAMQLETESLPKRKEKKNCYTVYQNTRIRKRADISTETESKYVNVTTSCIPQENVKSTKNSKSFKRSRSLRENVKKSETTKLDDLVKSVVNLSLNDTGFEMRKDILREQMTDSSIHDHMIDPVERSVATDRVNDTSEKENVNNKLENISEASSKVQNNVNKINKNHHIMLLCTEELENSMEEKESEIELRCTEKLENSMEENESEIGLRYTDNSMAEKESEIDGSDIPMIGPEINIVNENYTKTIENLSTKNENNRRNLVKPIAFIGNIITTTVIRSLDKASDVETLQRNVKLKISNRNNAVKLKSTKPLIVNRITSDSPKIECKAFKDLEKLRVSQINAYVKKLKDYNDTCEKLEMVKNILLDHSYSTNSCKSYNIVNRYLFRLKKDTMFKEKLRRKRHNDALLRAIQKLKKRQNDEVTDDQLDKTVLDNWERDLLSGNISDDECFHVSPSIASHSSWTARSNTDTVLRNIDSSPEITIVTDVKVENVNPEYSEENHETNRDFDWRVPSQIEQEEIDIKYEPSLDDDRSIKTESASETEMLERFQCETSDSYNSVPMDTDTSKLSYYDYQYRPKDPYLNLPRNYLNTLQNNSSNTNNHRTIEGDFELDNITVSFSDPLFSAHQTVELIDELPDVNSNKGPNENRLNSMEDLLEPLYYTDWTDQTHKDHPQATEPVENITNESSDQSNIEDTDAEVASIMEENINSLPKSSCKKRNVRSRLPQATLETERQESQCYKKRLRAGPKKATKYIIETSNETSSKKLKTKQLKETRYEKLFLRPIVALEKIDRFFNAITENAPKMITDVKVEATETIEDFLASDQTNVHDEHSDEECYREFDALIQELSTSTTSKKQKRGKTRNNNVNKKQMINNSKNDESDSVKRKNNFNAKHQDTNNADNNETNESTVQSGMITRRRKFNTKHQTDEIINDKPIEFEKTNKINTDESGSVKRNKNFDAERQNKSKVDALVYSPTNEDERENTETNEDDRQNDETNEDERQNYVRSIYTLYKLKSMEHSEMKALRQSTINGDSFKNAKYKCFKCVRTFTKLGFLNRHIGFSHNVECSKYVCKECECGFRNKRKLNTHITSHTRCYVCRWCPSQYLHLEAVNEHVKETHPIEYKSRSRKDVIYTCKLCKKEYNWYGSVYQHLQKIHEIKERETEMSNNQQYLKQYYTTSTDDMGMHHIVKGSKNTTKKFTEEECSSLTASNYGMWDYVVNLPNYDSGLTENSSGLTENSAGLTENSSSLTENSSGLTENSAGLTENSSSLTENSSGLAENRSGLAENRSGLTENRSGLTENRSDLTEKSSSLTENSLTENYPNLPENNSSSTKNDSRLTENNSSSIENNSRVSASDSNLTEKTLIVNN